MKQILGGMRKAIEAYEMIEDGDKIAVGVSGGKDSMLLLYALKLYQKFSPVKYELAGVTVSLGFKNFDLSPVGSFCQEIDVPYYIVDTDIEEIVFHVRKEKNPCSLCSKMRNGALHNKIKEIGFNKVALGHHADDVIETMFLSMLYSGRIATFKPVTYLSNKDIFNIRPLIYLKEAQVIGAIKDNNIPVVQSICPMDKTSKREEVKKLLKNIYKEIPEGRERLFQAIKNKDQYNLWS
ncbi:MAG: tRNA(Cytosine32)-2-thiocytidine synthetase [Clostridiales bacterium 38_11]|nr:MAG: tRNA(Cytosine32)-2-thiocytidine synthetase [Clostridiales bacterium 38_11]HBH12238.1 tRNA 2-thiocytidine(32) synthetase TtcA [Clostridiales bacterium]